jgi:hypothetical protein
MDSKQIPHEYYTGRPPLKECMDDDELMYSGDICTWQRFILPHKLRD